MIQLKHVFRDLSELNEATMADQDFYLKVSLNYDKRCSPAGGISTLTRSTASELNASY